MRDRQVSLRLYALLSKDRTSALQERDQLRSGSRDVGFPLLSKMAVSLSIHVSSNWKAFEKELQKLLLLEPKHESRRTESNAKKLDVLFRVVLATMVTSALVRQTNGGTCPPL